jgi:hypothetical protein
MKYRTVLLFVLLAVCLFISSIGVYGILFGTLDTSNYAQQNLYYYCLKLKGVPSSEKTSEGYRIVCEVK